MDGKSEIPLYGCRFFARAERPGVCEVYSWNLRDRLPHLEIPLKSPDGDAVVALQEVFDFASSRHLSRFPEPI